MKRTLCVALTLLLACTALLCASGGKEATATAKVDPAIMTPYGKYPELIEYTVGHSAESGLPEGVTLDDNAMTRLIQEKLNIKSKIAWAVPWSEYDQKVALCISSGEMTDFMRVNNVTFRQLVAAGMVEDLTESINKCFTPYVKSVYDSFPADLMESATYNGKIMAIPAAPSGAPTKMLWLRYDWLKQLGLNEPKTIDDVFEIAKQFVQKNPNGKVSVGLNFRIGDYAAQSLYPIFNAYGAYPESWLKDSSGKVYYGSTAPEMKVALAKLAERYKAGIFGKDLGSRSVEILIGAFTDNTTGMFFYDFWGPDYPLNRSRKTDPTADWRPYLIQTRADGKTVSVLSDYKTTYVVVRKGYAHPEALAKVWSCQHEAWDGITEEGKKIYADWTKQGITWTLVPVVAELDYFDQQKRDAQQIKAALEADSDASLPANLTAFFPLIKEAQANPAGPAAASQVAWSALTTFTRAKAIYLSDKNEYISAAFYGVTPTMETKWATLKTMEEEIILKIIVGEKPVAEFDKFVVDWKKLGGDEILQEIQKTIK